jgi:capsular exopolysaccharide synthesis family protein
MTKPASKNDRYMVDDATETRSLDSETGLTPGAGLIINNTVRLIYRLLSQYWHYLVFGIVGAVAIAGCGLVLITPRYVSTAELLLADPATQNLGSGDRSLTIVADNASIAADMSLLKSQLLALHVVRDLKLDTDPEFEGNATAVPDRVLVAAANELEKRIQIERPLSPYVFDISVWSRDPEKAQRLTNALIRAFLDREREVRKDALEQMQGWWTQRLDFPDVGGRIITPASLPERPSFPKSKLVILFAAILGATAGAVAAGLREIRDDRVRTHMTMEKTTGCTVIGMIPIVRDASCAVDTPTLLGFLTQSPQSHVGEVVRSIGAFLRLKGFDKDKKVLLVTSALPGEGKSATSVLVAASYALLGRKTVLVDCDIRRRSVSLQFADAKRGWNEVTTASLDLNAIKIKEVVSGLCVIPAVRSVDPAGDLLGDSVRNLLAQLRAEYDLIVIDVGPILGTIDAVALGALADEIVLVVEWGSTRTGNIIDAVKMMRMAGHEIGSVILNKVDYAKLRIYDGATYASYGYGLQHAGVAEWGYDGW